MIWIYITSFIIAYYIYKRSRLIKDSFVNYKKIVVTPTKSIYNGLQMNLYSKNIFTKTIADKIKNIYPIKSISYGTNSYQNILDTNKYSNIISFIQEVAYYEYYNNNKITDVRYICSIGLEKFTFITNTNSPIRNWTNINDDMTIGTLEKNTGSYLSLIKIKEALNLNFSVKTYKKITSAIANDIKNTNINGFFVITSHPDINIKNLQEKMPLRIFGTDGIDKTILDIIFPNLKKTKIDLTNYNIFTDIPNTLSSSIDVICNKNFSDYNGYNLISTIFKNFMQIKTYGNDNYKLNMKDFNPEYLYLTNDKYQLHNGVYNFYKEIGLITNNNSNACKYIVGTQQCNRNSINNYKLLGNSILIDE